MTPSTNRADRTLIVALAAVMWGFSGILREPLAKELPPLAVVFAEHGVLLLLVSLWLPSATRAFVSCSLRTKVSVVVIGIGSSALATTMFTAAFRVGDPITPQVLQKLQPVIAVVLAAVLLGERITRRFPLFAGPALVGAWLLSFADPIDVSLNSLVAGSLAVGAASLWAAGTVLGRLVSAELAFIDVTTLRFATGFVGLAVFAGVTRTSVAVPLDLVPQLVVLAIVPGFIALVLYYRALGQTPASRATLAELAFPLTAAAVGVTLMGAHLDGTQWFGFAIILVSVVGLALHENRAACPAVAVRSSVQEALEGQRSR